MIFSSKVRILSLMILVCFVVLICRLFYWQILKGSKLAVEAENQHYTSLEIPSKRGEILASDGLPLVSNKQAYLLYANLQNIVLDKLDIARRLGDVLSTEVPIIATVSGNILASEDIDALKRIQKEKLTETILNRLSAEKATWVNLMHFVDFAAMKKIKELNINGIGFENEDKRDYPESSMAAHILGFVGADQNGNAKGYFGIEGYFQRELSGKAGSLRLEKDAFGKPIAAGQELRLDKVDGRSLLTTIDRSVQRFVENNLEKGIATWKATGGTAIVADPYSGAILAMASFPRYDGTYFNYYSDTLYKNPAIADLFEPGSIFKPIVMAAAINEGKIDPLTKCDRCDQAREITGFYIKTFDNQYHSQTDMTNVLVNSDNTGMVFVGEKLGFSNLYSYLKRFGFGQKTGIDLEEEESGRLRDINDYYPIDQATMTFGQGVSVTSLQMVRAFSVLANGGFLPYLHVVSEILDGQRRIPIDFVKGPRVLSELTTKTVTEMLVKVSRNSPVHFPLDRVPELAEFKIAAKSGTAQIALGGKYKEKGIIGSVIGFFPADHPKFVVLVKLNEPEVRSWGSDTAGPIFFSIVSDLVKYYGMSP